MSSRLPFPQNCLVSYHYFKNYDMANLSRFTIIADSGAYSAKVHGLTIGVSDLCKWYTQWRSCFSWCAALDVIGDAAATKRNWEQMRDMGVDSVPTIHYPSPPSAIDYYASRGATFIGLGGQVRIGQSSAMRWVISVMRYARDRWPAVKFHGWGATGKLALMLPYFSVDSSSWWSGRMWGHMKLFHPGDPFKTFDLVYDGKHVFSDPELCNVLSTFYGVDPASVADSRGGAWAPVDLMSRSAAVLESHLRARHGVIAPPPELSGQTPGPRLHIVMPTEKNTLLRMAATLAEEQDALVARTGG